MIFFLFYQSDQICIAINARPFTNFRISSCQWCSICDVPQVLLYRLTLYLPPATRSSVPIEIIEAAKQTNELVKRVYDESLKGKDTK